MKEIDSKDIKMLWVKDYYDFPLTFICEYMGNKCYGKVVSDVGERIKYHLYSLTSQEIAEETKWNNLFKEHVGGHWEYLNGDKQDASLKPEREWAKFYEPYKAANYKLDPPDSQLIGYFLD